jgi:hypothetical protein
MNKCLGLIGLVMFPFSVNAGSYWTGALTDWYVSLDNGVVYVGASNMPAHCSYARAQIDTSSQIYSATYQRDLYAYVMTAYAAGKSLRIVVNDQETTCKVYGASDRP